jgi:hypothetical protein
MPSRGIVYADEVLCVAGADRLVVAIWHGVPSERHVALIDAQVSERIRLRSEAILLIVVEDAVLPDGPSRARMTQTMTNNKDALLAVQVCLEIGGVWGSTMRALGRALSLASRTRIPTLFSDAVPAALRELETLLGKDKLEAETATRIVEDLRLEYHQRLGIASTPPRSISERATEEQVLAVQGGLGRLERGGA